MTGGRLTVEDAYAYAKFARVVLKTNNVDFRARAASDEEATFLASQVAGRRLATTYADLETAPAVLLVAFEPEDESPIVQLRLRKAARVARCRCSASPRRPLAAWRSSGASSSATAPGDEPTCSRHSPAPADRVGTALREPGAVSWSASAPRRFRERSARWSTRDVDRRPVAWIPRRAGERGAVEAGLLPGCFRAVDRCRCGGTGRRCDSVGHRQRARRPRPDTTGMLRAAGEGELSALVMAGVDVHDLADPVTQPSPRWTPRSSSSRWTPTARGH